jgi:N-acetylglucosaminyldiphosphoundecaprenol N-acetyl-beta-D-mannosaminyltransferase
MTPERIDILGVGVSAINMDMAIETIDQWIAKRQNHYICCTDVHGIVRSQSDRRLREIQDKAGLVTPDGMPLVWISRLRNYRQVGRVYGPDLMSEVCSHSASRGYRHFLYGGDKEVPGKLADRLMLKYPGIQIVGTYSPPFRPLTPEEDEAIIQRINDSRTDIIWVGIGSPKQEYWMAAHLGRLDVPVMIGVGAAFDFLAGVKKQAPRWIQRSGFEWLFRLITEPRRLWRRYLMVVPLFVVYMALDTLGLRDHKKRVDHAAQ